MNSSRIPKRNSFFRAATILALIVLALPSTTLSVHGQSYGLKYDLGYSGIPFEGGAISLASNFTNTGQLTVRVTSVSFASDFWSNETRQVTSGFPFNLTAGTNKMVNTAVLIPASAAIGNHNITATATWQYSNNSAWFNTNPVSVSKIILVSQTIGSLFSSLAIILLIALGIIGAVVVSGVFLVARRRKKQKPGASLPSGPPRTWGFSRPSNFTRPRAPGRFRVENSLHRKTI